MSDIPFHWPPEARAEIERLHIERDEARKTMRDWSENCGAEVQRLRGEVTKYKARMQLMRGYMWSYSGSGTTLWCDFIRVKPEARDWFDQDGVPT